MKCAWLMATGRGCLGAAAGAGLASMARPRFADAAIAADTPDSTWLTYAVNVEMTWTKLPFLDRVRKVAEAGLSHYEFWQWRPKDSDAIARLNKERGLPTSHLAASP